MFDLHKMKMLRVMLLVFGVEELGTRVSMYAKIQSKWVGLDGTSFVTLSSGQKLCKFTMVKWLINLI